MSSMQRGGAKLRLVTKDEFSGPTGGEVVELSRRGSGTMVVMEVVGRSDETPASSEYPPTVAATSCGSPASPAVAA